MNQFCHCFIYGDMGIDEYQEDAYEFAEYPDEAAVIYPALALAEEAGEVAGKIAKAIRKHGTAWVKPVVFGEGEWEGECPIDVKAISREMGDVLWQLAALATNLGLSLDDIAVENLKKLKDRKKRGVIKGEGDNR